MRRRVTAAIGIAIAAMASPAGAAPTQAGELQHAIVPWHNCSACHWFLNPVAYAGEPDVAPMGWQGSMMANSARDPVFWAAVAIASQDAPGETELCVRCHAPRAFLEGYGSAIALEEIDYDDQGGVECDLCHRLVDDGVTPAGNAQYTVDDEAIDGFVPRRGPWTYADEATGPPHPWLNDSSLLGSSRLCGTCHDVTTARDRIGDDGTSLGVPFNEQRTYSEWLGSDFAAAGDGFASCQDCHMPLVEDVPGCEWTALSGATHPQGRRHDLAGVGKHMMGILEQIYGGAGLAEVPSFHYDHSAALVDDLVRTAATLQVDAPDIVDLGEGLDGLVVTVTNESGHKLPTGYAEGRVMWLEVVASIGEDIVWTSGRWHPDTGIEDDPQVRRYEAIAERFEDGARLHLLLSDHWVVDNRIPPRGLQPSLETDPVGDRYALQPDGRWPHADVVHYGFEPASVEDPTPDEPDTLTLQVRLLYLVNAPDYVEFLAEDNETNAAGDTVVDLFGTYGAPEPLVLAEHTLELDAVGLTPPGSDESSTTAGPGSTSAAPDTGSGGPPGSSTTHAADPEPATQTSGADQAAPAPDGCACTAGRGSPPAPVLLLLFTLLRRRRRR